MQLIDDLELDTYSTYKILFVKTIISFLDK